MKENLSQQRPRQNVQRMDKEEGAAQSVKTPETSVALIEEPIRLALEAASDKKALDPVLLDLRPVADFTDYFLITSGANTRQVQAIADEVLERLKRAGTPASRVEGYNAAEWVLIDYGDFVIHIFEDRARRFYDLERLWREARRIELPPGLTGELGSYLTREL